MRIPKRRFFAPPTLATIFAVAIMLPACSDDESGTLVVPTTGTIIFNFDHEVGSEALVLESSTTPPFRYTNAAGNTYNVEELEYLVSDFRLYRANGTSIGVEDFLFREAHEEDTRSYVWAGIPAGTYTAASFIFGLDAEKNVTGGLGASFLELLWPEDWGGGYHYMEMNGHHLSDDGVTVASCKTHTGRRFVTAPGDTVCPPICPPGPDLVAHHHYFEVKKAITPFEVKGGETWEITWVMDINGWYKDPVFDMDVWFPPLGPGNPSDVIMADLEAQALLMENGMKNVYRVVDAVKK
jgi:hypothetical protein